MMKIQVNRLYLICVLQIVIAVPAYAQEPAMKHFSDGTFTKEDLAKIEKSMRLINKEICPAPAGLIDESLSKLKASTGKKCPVIMKNLTARNASGTDHHINHGGSHNKKPKT